MKNCPYVDELITYTFPWTTTLHGKYSLTRWNLRSLLRFLGGLRKRRFDIVLDARADIRSNALMFLARAKRRVGYGDNGGPFFLTDVAKSDPSHPHRADDWAALLDSVGIPGPWGKPDLWISVDEEKWAKAYLDSRGIQEDDLVVGVHAGGSNPVKCWPEKNFEVVGRWLDDDLGVKVVVLVDPAGYGRCMDFAGSVRAEDLSLRELASVLARCDLLLCNDSGPMHMATAFRVPVVAIFGPSDPAFFGPLGKGDRVVVHNDCPYQPCFEYCRFDKPYCVTTIRVNEVKDAVASRLGLSRPVRGERALAGLQTYGENA